MPVTGAYGAFLQDVRHAVTRCQHEARQGRRERHHAERHVMFVLQQGTDKQFLVRKMWERMVQVDDLRGQHRQDLLAEILLKIALRIRVDILKAQMLDAMLAQQHLYLVENTVTLRIKFPHAVKDGHQLFARRHAALVVALVRLDPVEVKKTPDAHHEELIEVAREDFDELQPFIERHGTCSCSACAPRGLCRRRRRRAGTPRSSGLRPLFSRFRTCCLMALRSARLGSRFVT